MTTKGHRFHKLLAVLAGLCTAHAFARNRADARVRGNGCSRAFGAVPALTMTTTEQAGSGAGRDALRVVVVGGGWAGYSACHSISTNNIQGDAVEIILLDASKQAKGGLAGGYRTSTGRPAEAGIHGFWREYRNTFDIMEAIEGVDVNEVLGGFSPSVLYSKNGKVAVAPVLGGDNSEETAETVESTNSWNDWNAPSLRRAVAANLPPPLDLPILAELDGGAKLTPLDLASGLGLLGAWADFAQESRTSWARYDVQPASALLEKAGITAALLDELVSPLLHVLPMCPARDCSAAAALSCFHVFALQSRGAFDVRWCRGSIGERIFDPWQRQLEARGVTVRGGARVASIVKTERDGAGGYAVRLASAEEGAENEVIHCDAVVLAVGATAAGRLAAASPALSSLEGARDFDKLRGVTCVAVRLFLKPHATTTADLSGGSYAKTQLPPDLAEAMSDSPVTVCGAGIGGIRELEETGFCIYDLQRMHTEFSVDYYADNVGETDRVAVLEVDFYRANAFVDFDDDQIVDLALRAVSATFSAAKIDTDDVVDAAVLRARDAVSHFAPNSALYSPDVTLDRGLYACGDWVDRTGHASWSTEKSVVTARQAAAALSRDFGLTESRCDVIPAAGDTPQLTLLRRSARTLRSVLPPKTLPPSPWVFAKQILSGDINP